MSIIEDSDYFFAQLSIVLSSLPKEEAKRRLAELEKRRAVESGRFELPAPRVRSERSPN